MKGLIGILCTAISVASFAALPPFTVDVCVGDSTEPTMKFGVADGTAVTHPMPPFSGMFGVKDFYIDGGDGVTGDMKRLSEDIRADGADEQTWVICSTNSSARLTFRKGEGAPALYYWDARNNTVAELPETLSVKAGQNYAISTSNAVGAPSVQPDESHPYVGLQEATGTDGKKIYTSVHEVELKDAGDFILAFAPDSEELYVIFGDALVYKLSGGKAEKVAEAGKGWNCTLEHTSGSMTDVMFNDDLTVSFGAAADTTIRLTVTSSNGSCKQMGCYIAPKDGVTANSLYALRGAGKGTLDFDGDGKISQIDVFYFYNFQPSAEAGVECTVEELSPYTGVTDRGLLQAALENLQDMSENGSLDFDGDGKISQSDVFYFYNFQPAAEAGVECTVEELAPYTGVTDSGLLQTVLEILMDFAEE